LFGVGTARRKGIVVEPAVWSSYLIDLSPEEMVSVLAGAGWRASELSDEHGAALLARGRPAAVGREFRRFAEDHGLRFPQGHLWLTADIAAQNQHEVLDRLKEWLDLFAAVGVRAGVLHPGGEAMRQSGRSGEEVLQAQVAGLTALTRHVRGGDLVICLENIVSQAPLADDLRTIIDACGGEHLGICLDTGHLNVFSRLPLRRWWTTTPCWWINTPSCPSRTALPKMIGRGGKSSPQSWEDEYKLLATI